MVGLLVGGLEGPLGVFVGGASGVLVGSLFDEDGADETGSPLADISKAITTAGVVALLADVSEEGREAIDAVMAHLGATVLRRPASEVQAEVAAAEGAQRDAKKKASKEPRDARRTKQRIEADRRAQGTAFIGSATSWRRARVVRPCERLTASGVAARLARPTVLCPA